MQVSPHFLGAIDSCDPIFALVVLISKLTW